MKVLGDEMTLREFVELLDGHGFSRMIIGEAEIYDIVKA
jgi:hypothetical protein